MKRKSEEPRKYNLRKRKEADTKKKDKKEINDNQNAKVKKVAKEKPLTRKNKPKIEDYFTKKIKLKNEIEYEDDKRNSSSKKDLIKQEEVLDENLLEEDQDIEDKVKEEELSSESDNDSEEIHNMNEISEYEKKRLETIRQNQLILQGLSLGSLAGGLTTSIINPKPNIVQFKPKPKPKSKINNDRKIKPERFSRRLLGLQPQTVGDDKLKKNDLVINEDKEDRPVQTSFEATVEFLELINDLKDNDESNTIYEFTQKDSDSINDQDLCKRLKGLSAVTPESIKLCQERIYRLAFHPSSEKLLVACSSKTGELTLWDANYLRKQGNEKFTDPFPEEIDHDKYMYKFRPHYETVTGLKFLPNNNKCLLTGSYDGSIRKLHLDKQVFVTSYLGTHDNSITSIDINNLNSNLCYFSSLSGNVGIHDLRDNGSKIYNLNNYAQTRYQKIGCVSLNPVHEHIFTTSSLDRTVKVWDARFLSEPNPTPLHSVELSLSVTSAHFSPCGKKVVTTSYENTLKVFDYSYNTGIKSSDYRTSELPLTSTSNHNCRTGRYVTMFQAHFHPDVNVGNRILTVGDMQRSIDFYGADTGKPLVKISDKELITAVPAVIAYHPKASLTENHGVGSSMVAGTASGKVIILA